MAGREYYDTVEVRPGVAMLLRRKVGGGFSAVGQCRSLAGAQRLADELNGVRTIHVSDIREALRLLGLGTNKDTAQAADLLRLAVGPEPEPEEGT